MIISKIKNHLKITGVKKQKLAKDLGITPQYLSTILSGKNIPSIELENRIKSILK